MENIIENVWQRTLLDEWAVPRPEGVNPQKNIVTSPGIRR